MIKTVTTTAGVNTVTFPEFFKYFWIKNIGDTTVYASAFANVSAGVDNTSVIKSGDTVCVENIDNDNVYISGEGIVEIHAQNYADCPFKAGVKGGETPDLSLYAKTADVPNIKVNSAVDADTVGGLAANEIATNPNLLINPDFKINQRGVSGTFSETGKYFVDRWRLVSGAVTVNADGTLTLNGTISQIFENAVGDNVTASVSAGAATYDNSTKTFSITANGEIISWAKLEYGSNATQFFLPDPTTELLKCKRYFETKEIAAKGLSPDDMWIEGHIFDVPKRAIPSISLASSLGTPDTLSGITGADSEIKIVSYPNVAVDRINGSFCSQALGYITYGYRYIADAEIY